MIEECHVEDLTPNFAEGDFFEAADAFGCGNLPRTLVALRRHFFAGGDARPVITALQNRNRLLIQLRVLLDSGEVRVGQRGLAGVAKKTAGLFFVAIDDVLTGATPVAPVPVPAAVAPVPATPAPAAPLGPARAARPGGLSLIGAAAFGAISMLVGVLVGAWISRKR